MAHSSHGSGWKRLGDGSLLTQDADEGLGHIVPFDVYLKVLATLLVLTIVTVFVAQFDFGSLNVVVALTIASVKALLVAMFFMHLKFEGKTILMYAIYPIILLFLLVGGTVADHMDRTEPLPAHEIMKSTKFKPYIPPHDGHGAHDAHGGHADHGPKGEGRNATADDGKDKPGAAH